LFAAGKEGPLDYGWRRFFFIIAAKRLKTNVQPLQGLLCANRGFSSDKTSDIVGGITIPSWTETSGVGAAQVGRPLHAISAFSSAD